MRNPMQGAVVLAGGVAVILGSGMGVAAAPGASAAVGRASVTAAAGCTGRAAVSQVEFVITGPGGPRTVADLMGNVTWGDRVTAHFTVRAGCAPLRLTLASYHSHEPLRIHTAQTLFDADSDVFGEGPHTLEVTIPPEPPPGPPFFQVELATGPVLLPPNYGENGISHATGAAACLAQITSTGRTYADLQGAVNAAPDGATLTVTGTCDGPTRIEGRDLSIIGDGATLNGERHGSVLTIISSSVTLEKLTIENGHSFSNGGGINSEGSTVTLDDSTVRDNTSVFAGGILNGGGAVMTVRDSSVTGNTAEFHGGGIDSHGTLDVIGSTVETNHVVSGYGGGVVNEGGSIGQLTLDHSTVGRGNTADNGGGIFNNTNSTATMENGSTVTGNTAQAHGGGIFNNGGTLHGAVAGTNVYDNDPDNIYP